MAAFALTFNKVAADLHFDRSQVNGLRVRVQDGNPMFQPASAIEAGVWPLEERTRGGLGVTLTGTEADHFLIESGMQAGDHLVLGAIRDGWITTRRHVPVPGQDKPSKIWPTARIWSISNPPDTSDEAPSFCFALQEHSSHEGGYTFVATLAGIGAAFEARFKADLLKLRRWCGRHIGDESNWRLSAAESTKSRLQVEPDSIRAVHERTEFSVTLWVADEYGPQVRLTFGT